MFEVQELNFFDLMGDQMQGECPGCGGSTGLYVVTCEACGHYLNGGEEAALDLREGAVNPPLHKTPMEEAGHLIRLQQARAELAQGKSAEAFYAEVEAVLDVVESALELYDSEFMRHQLKRMTAPAARIYHAMASAAGDMQLGLHQMLSYIPGDSLQVVDAGLLRLEQALWKVDAAQDTAIELASAC